MTSDLNRRGAMKILIRCARERRVLAPCLFLSEVNRSGDHPFGGGGFSDVWRGTYRGQAVAVKVLRVFSNQGNSDLKQVRVWSQGAQANGSEF